MSRGEAESERNALERVQQELIRRMDGGAHLPLGQSPDMTVPRTAGSPVSITVDEAGIVRGVDAVAPSIIGVGDDLSGFHGYSYLRDLLRAGARQAPFLLTAGEDMLVLVGEALPDGGIHLVRAEPIWSPALDALADTLFGLTQREREVLEGLTAGLGAAEIAVAAGRSEGTVRQQIKSILGKLGVRSQARAVALIGQIAAIASTGRGSSVPPAPIWSARADCDWIRYGRPGGLPVLFFHGALFGIAGTTQEREAAPHVGLDIVAPLRPGYGRTVFPKSASDVVTRSVAQADLLLDQLGIGPVVVMAHDIGTLFAYAYAAARPDRVLGIVAGPTTPPMHGWEQTADMPPLHRINAFAAQRFPKLMDWIVVLGMRQIARRGEQIIPGLVFGDSAWDRQQWETAGVSPQSWWMAQAQDGRGFRHDMMLTNTDWSDTALRVPAPVMLYHGARSKTVARRGVEDLLSLSRNPLSKLVIFEDTGHVLPVTDPGVLLRACSEIHAITGHLTTP